MHRILPAAAGTALLALLSQVAAAGENPVTVPDCKLQAVDGGQAYATRQPGKVLYIDFWASWCAPCAKSFPFLDALHKEFAAQGLQVIGVNLDEQAADAKQFLTDYPVSFPIVSDPGEACAKSFSVAAMPSSYLIGRDGSIRHIQMGFRPGETEDLRSIVKQLLTEEAAHDRSQ